MKKSKLSKTFISNYVILRHLPKSKNQGGRVLLVLSLVFAVCYVKVPLMLCYVLIDAISESHSRSVTTSIQACAKGGGRGSGAF